MGCSLKGCGPDYTRRADPHNRNVPRGRIIIGTASVPESDGSTRGRREGSG
jgi:hypothetical protein